MVEQLLSKRPKMGNHTTYFRQKSLFQMAHIFVTLNGTEGMVSYGMVFI